jgi:hypothetical protein
MPLQLAVPQAAAQSRNPDVMLIVIEESIKKGSRFDFGTALITATERENEKVVKLLLLCDQVTIDDDSRTQARQRAAELGLESMLEMLVRE